MEPLLSGDPRDAFFVSIDSSADVVALYPTCIVLAVEFL